MCNIQYPDLLGSALGRTPGYLSHRGAQERQTIAFTPIVNVDVDCEFRG